MKDKEKAPPQWYVNCQGQTMVVFPGPVEEIADGFAEQRKRAVMTTRTQHRERIGRTFALAAKSVTVEQCREIRQGLRTSGGVHTHGGFAGGGNVVVSGGGVLQLAERGRRH